MIQIKDKHGVWHNTVWSSYQKAKNGFPQHDYRVVGKLREYVARVKNWLSRPDLA